VETKQIALIRYVSPEGVACVGSGLLVTTIHVLTADHVADGTDHRVTCASGTDVPVATSLRSHDPAVDLAVLTLSTPVSDVTRMLYAQVDRGRATQVNGCVAVGFPRWRKSGAERLTAQVSGYIPTAEGLTAAADDGLRAGYLTLVGDRIPGAPPIPEQELHERSPSPPGVSPWGGMSGAAVVVADMVIGVVRSYNLAAGGQSLTVTPLTALERLPLELQRRFLDTLGVDAPRRLRVLPARVEVSRVRRRAPVLSADVQDKYRPVISAALGSPALPAAWTLDELSELRRKAEADEEGTSRLLDSLSELCQAVAAKPVFLAVGGDELELGQLQVIYRREIGAWPTGASADALLTEAASAGLAEPGSQASRPLGALARFMLAVAAARGVPPEEAHPLTRWLGQIGHQLADARAHYQRCEDDSAWLLIDLGDEPPHGAGPWPTEVTWMLLTRDEAITGEPVACEPTADGLRRALTFVLRQVPPARPLLVDLAVPRALMDEGIEHWPLIEVDGAPESLSAECRARLRWSRRRRDARLHNRVLDRLELASWDGGARRWARKDPRYACFVGGHDPVSQEDQLRLLLREGCGFAIWFASGLPGSALGEINKAVRGIPVPARRDVLPDHLPGFSGNRPAVIWDDPRGRGRFQLPPLAAPESP
jgi:vWA-MoxR associated protein C-terminal domain